MATDSVSQDQKTESASRMPIDITELVASSLAQASNNVLNAPDDVIRWIEREFYIPETGQAIVLEDYQRRVVREALAKDANGLLKYSLVLYSDLKKSAKSTLAAAVVLFMAWHSEWETCRVVANDLKQANSRTFYYIERAILLNPRLKSVCTIKNYTIYLPNHTIIEAIPVDPKGEAGGGDLITCFTELWAAKSDAAKQLWCYDDQTEILTSDGWKLGVDLDDSDVVATVQPETHILEWEHPKSIYRNQYQGEMHLYDSVRFSECVTPNHRLYGMFSTNSRENPRAFTGVMRSDDLRTNGQYAVYFPLTTVAGYRFEDCTEPIHIPAGRVKPAFSISRQNWFQYLGWFLSEGRVKHNGEKPYSVYICQSPTANPVKWQMLKELHDSIFGVNGWRLGNHNTDFVVDCAPLAQLIKHVVGTGTFGKFIAQDIKNAAPSELTALLDAFIAGDGHRMKHGSVEIPVGSLQLADDICEIAFKLGYNVTVRDQHPTGRSKTLYKRIRIWKTPTVFGREVARRQGHWKTQTYDGLVWCPSTRNGLIVVRRKGKIYVSGNTETTLSPLKYGKSLRWCESYAGYVGESPILEQLYDTGVRQGTRVDVGLEGLELYTNDTGRMLCLWNTVPRCYWQTTDYYAQEATILAPSEFERIHRNQWQASFESFIPPEWWAACESPYPAFDEHTPVVVGVDAAVSNDCFAMVGVSRIETETYVRFVRVWTPPKQGKINFAEPEAFLRQCALDYNLIQVAYDSYQLVDMANRLQRDGVGWFKSFSQGSERAVADKQLYDNIRDRRVHHNGLQPELTAHLMNANRKPELENMLRLIKREATGSPIDAAVALSMANREARRLNIG